MGGSSMGVWQHRSRIACILGLNEIGRRDSQISRWRSAPQCIQSAWQGPVLDHAQPIGWVLHLNRPALDYLTLRDPQPPRRLQSQSRGSHEAACPADTSAITILRDALQVW